MDVVGRHAPQGHGGDHPQRAQADLGGLERLGLLFGGAAHHLAGGSDQGQSHHLARDVAEALAGAMRRRGDGTADGLVADVTHVLHGEAEMREGVAQLDDGDARLGGDRACVAIDLEDLVAAAELDQAAVGDADVGERMAAAGDLHMLAASPSRAHDCNDLLLRGR